VSVYTTRPVDDWRPRNEAIVEALVIAFVVIVLDELCDRSSEVLLSDRNYPIETFFLNRSDEPSACALAFGARTGIRTTRMPAS